jgi:DNA-binding transcriptional ArsR family regulator
MVTYKFSPNERETDDLVWKALSDRKRRMILEVLASGPKLTGELVDQFSSIGRTAVLKHIDILQDAQLITFRREGRRRWNYLNPDPIQSVCTVWVARHVGRVTSSIARLQALAETRNSDIS